MGNLVKWFLRQFTYVRKLEKVAFCDDLTGLLRRGRFFELFGNLLAEGNNIGVVYIDLNGFKSVNDRLGHAVGDGILKAFARHADTFFSERDGILGRIGGDEFVVVLPNVPEERLDEICVRFAEFLSFRPFVYRNERILIDFSCGIATTKRDGRNPDILLMAADERMFNQKRRVRKIQRK